MLLTLVGKTQGSYFHLHSCEALSLAGVLQDGPMRKIFHGTRIRFKEHGNKFHNSVCGKMPCRGFDLSNSFYLFYYYELCTLSILESHVTPGVTAKQV